MTGYVYFIEAHGGPIKVGHASNPFARMSQLQTAAPSTLRLLAAIPGTQTDERAVHLMFAGDRLSGEWFAPTELLRAVALSGVLPDSGPADPAPQRISPSPFGEPHPTTIWRKSRKRRGLCSWCHRKAAKGASLCPSHRKANRERAAARRERAAAFKRLTEPAIVLDRNFNDLVHAGMIASKAKP